MSGVVVRLPTAAPRQVKQHRNKGTRALREQLPQFPDRHIFPSVREAAEKIRPVREAGAAADRQLLMAILRSLDKRTQAKARVFLALAAAKNDDTEGALQALAIVKFESETRTFGENWDIQCALRLMDEGKL